MRSNYRLLRQINTEYSWQCNKKPVLLVVGCGDVGLRLVRMLRQKIPAARLRIIATHRSPEKAEAIRQAGATPYFLDLDTPVSAQRRKRLAGIARWIINLSPPPNDSLDSDPRSVRLLQHFGRFQATFDPMPGTRMVYISTSGVYGDCQGDWVDESRPVKAKNARAIRRVAAEKLHRKAGACVLRAPGIYGHDRLPIDRLKAGTPALRAEDDMYTNHIHAEDLAMLSWLALFRANATRVFNASDDSQMKMGDYFDAVALAFNLAKPPRLSRAEVSQQVSPMMMSFMSESRRLLNNRIKKELRAKLRYPTMASTLSTNPL